MLMSRGIANPVNSFHVGVDGSVKTNREVRVRNIVVDRSWQTNGVEAVYA